MDLFRAIPIMRCRPVGERAPCTFRHDEAFGRILNECDVVENAGDLRAEAGKVRFAAVCAVAHRADGVGVLFGAQPIDAVGRNRHEVQLIGILARCHRHRQHEMPVDACPFAVTRKRGAIKQKHAIEQRDVLRVCAHRQPHREEQAKPFHRRSQRSGACLQRQAASACGSDTGMWKTCG